MVKSIGCTVMISDGEGFGSAGVLLLESEDDDEKGKGKECCRRLLRILLKKVEWLQKKQCCRRNSREEVAMVF